MGYDIYFDRPQAEACGLKVNEEIVKSIDYVLNEDETFYEKMDKSYVVYNLFLNGKELCCTNIYVTEDIVSVRRMEWVDSEEEEDPISILIKCQVEYYESW
jgi:hypothetical protein